MKKLLAAFAVTTVLASQAPAHAAVITISPPGVLSNGGQIATFDGQTATPYLQVTQTGLFVDGGATFTGSGIIMNNHGAGSAGLYAQPFHTDTNYLAILGGGSETIDYGGDRNKFGLYWGSIDAYNTIAFYNNNALVASYNGAQIAPLIANGGQASDNSNRYVTFSDLVFDKVVLSSGANSFEVDNIAASAPELSTWAMMLLGFAGVGFVAWRRAQKNDGAVEAG